MACINGRPSTPEVVGANPTVTVPDSRACCAARTALQQARGQLALQPRDLLAERGLHHVQVQRSAAHGALLHHTYEIAQLSQFHRGPRGPSMVAQDGLAPALE